MLIKVKVISHSKRQGVIKKAVDSFEVRVKSKPLHGQANKEAKEIFFNKSNFDYIKGRVLLVIFIENTFNPKLYNKYNGQNAAEIIIDSLQKTDDENNSTISKMHQENVTRSIREIKKQY